MIEKYRILYSQKTKSKMAADMTDFLKSSILCNMGNKVGTHDWIKALCFLNLFLCLFYNHKEMRLFLRKVLLQMCVHVCVQFVNLTLGWYNNKVEFNLDPQPLRVSGKHTCENIRHDSEISTDSNGILGVFER